MNRQFSKLVPFLALVVLATTLAACGPATAVAPAQATLAPAAEPTQAPVPTQAPADQPTAAPVPAAGVSYAQDVQPIFDQNCVACHGGSNGTMGGLSLKTYADLMNGSQDGQVINPGDAANSMLVQAISSGKMPRNSAKLPQATIDIISAWVAAGATNN